MNNDITLLMLQAAYGHYPAVSPRIMSEALAAGAGFSSVENFDNAVRDSTGSRIVPSCRFNADAFMDILLQHGNFSREALPALHDDITSLLEVWQIHTRGASDSPQLRHSSSLWSKNAKDNARLLRELNLSRGRKRVQRPFARGGYQGSLNWLLFRRPRKKGETSRAGISMNVNAPRGSVLEWRDFGWAPRASDEPLLIGMEGLLKFLIQNEWLGKILRLHTPLAHDFIGEPARFMNGYQLPFLSFATDSAGIVIRGQKEWKAGTETVLAVETLVRLGDALADEMLQRGLEDEKKTALRWRELRLNDGLHPFRDENSFDKKYNEEFEKRIARWYAGKLGISIDEYKALLHAPEYSEETGCSALQALNSDMFHIVYYRRWPERRSMTIDEYRKEREQYNEK